MSILVNVVNQKMYVSSTMDGIVEGSQEFVKFRFILSEEWDNLVTFAQFIQGGNPYNVYLDKDNSVFLPPEIVAGACTLMLYGTRGTTIGTTNYLTLKINKNNFVSDASSTDISETLYMQLVDMVNNMSAGGVKPGEGLALSEDGYLYAQIDTIVKTGVTANSYQLTDDEQRAACGWLGVDKLIEERIGAISFAEEVAF